MVRTVGDIIQGASVVGIFSQGGLCMRILMIVAAVLALGAFAGDADARLFRRLARSNGSCGQQVTMQSSGGCSGGSCAIRR